MREIKFRAWETERKTMSYGKREDFDDMVGFRFDHEEGGERILMQYTGLKDAYGSEIYEGDVLEDGYVRGSVVFDEGKFIFEWDNIAQDLFESCDVLTVIGNIYEHPELVDSQ